MTTFVFLGPSLPRQQAAAILDAVLLPPVAMGDLYALVATRARAGDRVAIIDGLFEQAPAVWHKEILFAITRGVRVYGAASMGALRAAELRAFGMVGVGRIFEALCSGELEDDDEVAVAHGDAEHGFRSLSLAMASLRFALQDLVREGELGAAEAELLIDRLKPMPYHQRTWGAVLEVARTEGMAAGALDALRSRAAAPDAKARDAAALLQQLAAEPDDGRPGPPPNFTFQHTSFWKALTISLAARVEDGADADRTAQQDIAAFYRAGGRERDRVLDEALLAALVTELARDHRPDADELKAAARELARRNGLADAGAVAAWRREQRLGDQEWPLLLQLVARKRWLSRQMAGRLDQALLRMLKANGYYAEVRQAHDRVAGEFARLGLRKPTLGDFGLTPEQLQAAYEGRFGRLTEDPGAHAAGLGFGSLREFVDNLLKQHLADAQARGERLRQPELEGDDAR